MNAILIIAITLLMSGESGYFIDYELRIPQKDITVCEEARRDIRGQLHTNSSEYRDEYNFKIRGTWCVDK